MAGCPFEKTCLRDPILFPEYAGLIASLRDALRRALSAASFEVDSLLVARQAGGIWLCRSPELTPYYEEALQLLDALRIAGCRTLVRHIFREFNSEADSLANRVLDMDADICESWHA